MMLPGFIYSDDHNRIVLHPLDEYEDHQGEFVNACFIDVREIVVAISIDPYLNILCIGLFKATKVYCNSR